MGPGYRFRLRPRYDRRLRPLLELSWSRSCDCATRGPAAGAQGVVGVGATPSWSGTCRAGASAETATASRASNISPLTCCASDVMPTTITANPTNPYDLTFPSRVTRANPTGWRLDGRNAPSVAILAQGIVTAWGQLPRPFTALHEAHVLGSLSKSALAFCPPVRPGRPSHLPPPAGTASLRPSYGSYTSETPPGASAAVYSPFRGSRRGPGSA